MTESFHLRVLRGRSRLPFPCHKVSKEPNSCDLTRDEVVGKINLIQRASSAGFADSPTIVECIMTVKLLTYKSKIITLINRCACQTNRSLCIYVDINNTVIWEYNQAVERKFWTFLSVTFSSEWL